MAGSAVDVDSLVGANVGLDGFADARDAVGVESDGRAVERFDPVDAAALFAFCRGDMLGGRVDLVAKCSESIGGRVTDVECEKYVAGTGVDAAGGQAEDALQRSRNERVSCCILSTLCNGDTYSAS